MGDPRDIVELKSTALDLAAGIGAVSVGAGGGVAAFVGITRGEKNTGGRELAALDYEAYPEMVVEQMRDLARTARKRWPIERIVIQHRTGRVEVGEPSVLVAVSTPHRAEAFEACRFLIDELKRSAAIWKKEIWKDGSATWQQGGHA
jgi:molybdopterin synthase catalytic subunit